MMVTSPGALTNLASFYRNIRNEIGFSNNSKENTGFINSCRGNSLPNSNNLSVGVLGLPAILSRIVLSEASLNSNKKSGAAFAFFATILVKSILILANSFNRRGEVFSLAASCRSLK